MAELTTITANGASGNITWVGGQATLTVTGTFDGAYFEWQYSVDSGSTWHHVFPPNPSKFYSSTSNTDTVYIPAGLIRIFVYNAGASTDVDINVEPFGLLDPKFEIFAAGVFSWTAESGTDNIPVDGLLSTDIVLANLAVARSTEFVRDAVNDAANDQIEINLSGTGVVGLTKVSYMVIRPVA